MLVGAVTPHHGQREVLAALDCLVGLLTSSSLDKAYCERSNEQTPAYVEGKCSQADKIVAATKEWHCLMHTLDWAWAGLKSFQKSLSECSLVSTVAPAEGKPSCIG